jgi:ubiquinone/menaquinone biosynthesis C-methylase UbiE
VAFDQLAGALQNDRQDFLSILDAGCGFGKALPMLDEHFRPDRMVGLDVDPEMPIRAEREAGRCRSQVEFLVGALEEIDQPDGCFDLVFCHQTLHHISDQERAVREIYRVLKPGGVLLLAESCRRFIHSLLIRALFRHPMDVQKSADEYVELLRDAGFTVYPSRIFQPYLWWSRPDLGMLEWLGLRVPADHQETLVNVVASKAA